MKALILSKDNCWTRKLVRDLERHHHKISYSSSLCEKSLKNLKPDWIFFFHWSDIVPEVIYQNYRCAVIHTGNLPQGRGGSPLQNQILEEVTSTKVNVIEMGKKIDGGGVYCSAPISLQGSITDIWLVIADVACNLIKYCMDVDPHPTPQTGECQTYKRIKNNIIDFGNRKQLTCIYNQIRMVDDPSYPNPYFDIGGFRLEFSRAELKNDQILADVTITQKQ